jgi:DNA (cytosine-5)-methyltransferase 1
LYANDKDLAAIETYKKNFPETPCTHEDVDSLNFYEIMTTLGL